MRSCPRLKLGPVRSRFTQRLSQPGHGVGFACAHMAWPTASGSRSATRCAQVTGRTFSPPPPAALREQLAPIAGIYSLLSSPPLESLPPLLL